MNTQRTPSKAVRLPVSLRVNPQTMEWLDEITTRTGHKRSDVLKALLAVGRKHQAEAEEILKGKV